LWWNDCFSLPFCCFVKERKSQVLINAFRRHLGLFIQHRKNIWITDGIRNLL
jgi:hypothetical protein